MTNVIIEFNQRLIFAINIFFGVPIEPLSALCSIFFCYSSFLLFCCPNECLQFFVLLKFTYSVDWLPRLRIVVALYLWLQIGRKPACGGKLVDYEDIDLLWSLVIDVLSFLNWLSTFPWFYQARITAAWVLLVTAANCLFLWSIWPRKSFHWFNQQLLI